MFKLFFLFCVLSSSVNAKHLLMTDSFSLLIDQRLKSDSKNASYKMNTQFKYDHYFTWILKNLLNRKLASNVPENEEWASIAFKDLGLALPTQLSLMSSNIDDFGQMTKNINNSNARYEDVLVYTPLLDLCHVLDNFSSSTEDYVKWKFKKFIDPLQEKIPNVRVVHSNNILSWMGRPENKKKTNSCMSKNIDDMMLKFTFCPRLALLLQQEIPKEMLTTIANQIRDLKEQTKNYVKTNKSKITLLSESDYLDFSAEDFGNDCVHLNTKGHQLLASKFLPIWSK